MTVTEVETTTVEVAQFDAPASVMFSEDMSAYERIARTARAAWKDHTNPLAAYFDRGMVIRKFGVEIEFNDSIGARSWGGNKYAAWLFDNGYTQYDYCTDYHQDEENFSEWRYEDDCTVNGGEVISPIMDTSVLFPAWEQIHEVMTNLSRIGATAHERNAGGHISIHSEDMGTTEFRRLLTLCEKFEDVMYRLATNPHRMLNNDEMNVSRHRGVNYAGRIRSGASERFDEYENGSNIMNRGAWINYDSWCNRIEFRIFDGSLDPALTQTFALIASKFVDAACNPATDATIADMPDRLRGAHIKARKEDGLNARSNVEGEAWEKDTVAIRQFVDLLFDNNTDKERVITLFVANDWNYQQDRMNWR